jgi:hypothetical protein
LGRVLKEFIMLTREHESLLEINDLHACEVPAETPTPRSRLPIFTGLAVVTLAVAGWTQRPRAVIEAVVTSSGGASDLAKEGTAVPVKSGLDFSLRTKDYPHKAPGNAITPT